MEQITVEWCVDRTDDLAIKHKGHWYTFIGLKHPSEIDIKKLTEESLMRMNEGMVDNYIRGHVDTTFYTYEIGEDVVEDNANELTVEWTISRRDKLAIKYNGRWYGFAFHRHPSEVSGSVFLRGGFTPYVTQIELDDGLRVLPTQSYTYKLGE